MQKKHVGLPNWSPAYCGEPLIENGEPIPGVVAYDGWCPECIAEVRREARRVEPGLGGEPPPPKLKKTTIDVLHVGPLGHEHLHPTTAYQVAGHLHVCRDPRNTDYWTVVHAPTGLHFDEGAVGFMPFKTRRRAAAVAAHLGEKVPELTTLPKIKTFIRRNRGRIQGAFQWACLATIGI